MQHFPKKNSEKQSSNFISFFLILFLRIIFVSLRFKNQKETKIIPIKTNGKFLPWSLIRAKNCSTENHIEQILKELSFILFLSLIFSY